jgi:hypothetical protein
MSYFVYDGTSIKTLLPGSELTIGVLDSFDEIDGNLGREIIKGEMNSERYSPNYITSLFNEVVNFDLFIYKTNESDFTTDEQRKLTKLLTNARTPKWFSSYDCNDNLIANYRGLFTQITYKIFSGLKGFQVHFENDSPYDYDIIKDKTLYDMETIAISCDSDETIYPLIKVTGATGEKICLKETINDVNGDKICFEHRNIATGSDNVVVGDNGWLNGNWKLYGGGATLTVEDMSGTGIDVYGSGNGLKIQQNDITEVQSACYQSGCRLDGGEYYTLSCWVRSNANGAKCRLAPFTIFNGENSGYGEFDLTTEWQYISYTSDKKTSSDNYYSASCVYFRNFQNAGDYMEVANIKLEKGKMATEWCCPLESLPIKRATTKIMTIRVIDDPVYIDCKNCMIYRINTNGETVLCSFESLGIDNAKDLDWFEIKTELYKTNKFECYKDGSRAIRYGIKADYIIPQKRALRWE